MSGTGEERWRNSRGQQNAPPQNAPPQNQNQNRHGNQQPRQNSSREGGGPQSKQNTGGQGFKAIPGNNAWVNSDRGNRDWTAQGPPVEQHVPVRGFNALEVRDTLKTAYNSVTSEDGKPLKYKASANQSKNAKSSGPWAAKPNTMGNGKDFFLELRKQMSALEQGGERAGG